jgi:hypothetical protein
VKALSLSQPWASIVVFGPKRIENRPMTPSLYAQARRAVGTTIGIHAAKSYDPGIAVEQARRELGLPGERKLPRGAMLATARLADVLFYGELQRKLAAGEVNPDQERWAFGPLCILLADVVALPAPIPCRGMLGFWTVPADVERAMGVSRG